MHVDFAQAIRDNPHDELVALAFADWLEEQGEAARGEFVRASCAAGPGAGQADRERAAAAFARCRPGWWKPMPYRVDETPDRGLIDLHPHGRADIRLLGTTTWLSRATAAGWLGVVRVVVNWNGELSTADLRAAWLKQARGLALGVDCLRRPQPARLRELLDMPELCALGLPVDCFDADTAGRVAAHAGLRTLTLRDIGGSDREAEGRAFAAAACVPRLKHLTIHGTGFGPVPTPDELIRATANPSLRRFWHDFGPIAAAANFPTLRAARPNLAVAPKPAR